MTSLCVSIFVNDIPRAKGDIARAAEAGADLVELRIDRFTEPHAIRQLVEQSILPAIVTCRASWEGGQCDLPDEKRLRLLQLACHGQTRYVDVELEAVRRGHDLPVGRPVICSFHDFDGRPDKLHSIVLEMSQRPASVNKIVWTARSIRDCFEAFELLLARSKPTIALCMGEAGVITRILAKKFGALLTFASLADSSATAPGQLTIAQLKNLYRWDAINADTRVYGVVASPVRHSMSPAIHNAAFAEVGHDGVYLPMLVEGTYESFKAFMEMAIAMPALHLSGLSITIPHKENALRYLIEKGAQIEPLAAQIGAVNTVVIRRNAAGVVALEGYNSDYAAILDSITSAMGVGREQLRGLSAGVIGAGGTGRTAVAGLRACGVEVTIYNRSMERAAHLAAEFACRAALLSDLASASHSLYLNTTSIGMSPQVEQSIFEQGMPKLSKQTLVFDAVYNPPTTKLLRQSEEAGAIVISGLEMFVRQAARQFELWTDRPAPVALMRQTVLSGLAQPS